MENKKTLEKKNKTVYEYIIYVFMVFIIVLLIILLNNKSNTPTKEKETPEPVSILTISLNGDKEITIIKGESYQEPGYTAKDTIEGDLTNKVIVEGNVNENVVGSYTIKYKVTNYAEKTTEETRIVNVIEDLDIEIDYSPKELTNEDVTITLKVNGDYFDSIIDPDGGINSKNYLEYPITNNDEYTFTIKRLDGSTIKKEIIIGNIDKKKPTGTCKNTVTNEKTVIEVTANDENGIKKYNYKFNNKNIELESNTHTINEKAYTVSVDIYDKAGNYETINCVKKDDTWPVIEKQQYQKQSAKNYNQNLRYGQQMRYILYYPDNLNLNEKHPLVVYLHGMGEFGRDINNTLAATSSFTNNMKSGKFQQSAIFLAPQCYSGNKKWTECFDDLKGLIDYVVKTYNVDTNKISMTGHSLGGEAVFNFIVQYPGFLAAAAPLAPSRINKDYNKMKDLKIAVFTGTKDNLYKTNPQDSQYLIDNGVNLKFYPLQDVSHSSQNALFNGTNVIDWLISQSK